MVKRENELRVQEVTHLRNGKGKAVIHHIIEGDELKNKGKMFSNSESDLEIIAVVLYA